MYGETLLQLIPDVDDCDCFLFVGAIAAAATTHLALAPGEDWAFMIAMLKIIFDGGLGVTSIDDDGGSLPVFGPANL